jgi:predicted kinase
VATLVLVNGPPASGKSTIADALVASRPLALDLDIDVIRGQLGCWSDDPCASGLTARALAVSMATRHLTGGHDVVVAQFLARVDFIEELERAASVCNARFVEVALMIGRSEALEAFEQRRRTPTASTHADAALLVDAAGGPDALGEMYDRYLELLERRPNAHRIPVTRGDIDATAALVEAAIGW